MDNENNPRLTLELKNSEDTRLHTARLLVVVEHVEKRKLINSRSNLHSIVL
jgi:hypothetical protein